jgi:LAS superfamily LD-carboxypeptidase LdcB
MLNTLELTGRADSHVRRVAELDALLHAETATALAALRAAAAREGLALYVTSGFRDFERQAAIWNAKFRGERPLYDRSGRRIERSSLSERQAIQSILAWSALPGASRHHWGSDCDVIDAEAVPEGYRPQLQPAEFAPDGVFARLSGWLSENAARFGFYRPYATDRGGVMPEPWHLSYAPVAVGALEALTLDALREALATAGALAGRDLILAALPELYERFVLNVDEPPGVALSGA